jgi:hypothetical protein
MNKLRMLCDELKLILTAIVLFPLIAAACFILKITNDDDENDY